MIQSYWADSMPGIEQQQAGFQFGVFELNPRMGELRKHGVKLKVQDQPLQILTLLLEHAGEVVTREDIQKRLWSENTYVDFDNAINSAVRKLRDALGDSPENPRCGDAGSPRIPVYHARLASHGLFPSGRNPALYRPDEHRNQKTPALVASLRSNGGGDIGGYRAPLVDHSITRAQGQHFPACRASHRQSGL
jgi:hypothetical protein